MNKSINESNLNREQFERLKELYVETIVDSMSMEDFRQYVRNDMNDFLYKCSESELINEIKYTLDEDFLDEMLSTIRENRRD